MREKIELLHRASSWTLENEYDKWSMKISCKIAIFKETII